MKNTSAVTVIHCTYKLLKILSCFIFFQSSFTCLAQEKRTELRQFTVSVTIAIQIELLIRSKQKAVATSETTVLQFCQTALHQSQIPKQCIFLSC